MRRITRLAWVSLIVLAATGLSSCNTRVGVGVSVGVPIGHHGHMSVGTGRWY